MEREIWIWARLFPSRPSFQGYIEPEIKNVEIGVVEDLEITNTNPEEQDADTDGHLSKDTSDEAAAVNIGPLNAEVEIQHVEKIVSIPGNRESTKDQPERTDDSDTKVSAGQIKPMSQVSFFDKVKNILVIFAITFCVCLIFALIWKEHLFTPSDGITEPLIWYYKGEPRSALELYSGVDSDDEEGQWLVGDWFELEFLKMRKILNNPQSAIVNQYLQCGEVLLPHVCFNRFLFFREIRWHGLSEDKKLKIYRELINQLKFHRKYLTMNDWLKLTDAFKSQLEGRIGILLSGAVDRKDYVFINRILSDSGYESEYTLTEKLIKFLTDYRRNLTDSTIAVLSRNMNPESASTVLLDWEGKLRQKNIDSNWRKEFERYQLITRNLSHQDKYSRQLRDSLWYLPTDRDRYLYLHKLAEVTDKNNRTLRAVDRLGARETFTIQHRILLSSYNRQASLLENLQTDIFPKIFINSKRASSEYSYILQKLSNFIKCWRSLDSCSPDTVRNVSRKTSNIFKKLDTELIHKPINRVYPKLPHEYWVDIGFMVNRSRFSVSNLKLMNLSELTDLQFSARDNEMVRRLISSKIKEIWNSNYSHTRIPWSQVDWWIKKQSDWDINGENYRARTSGLLQFKNSEMQVENDRIAEWGETTEVGINIGKEFFHLAEISNGQYIDITEIDNSVIFWSSVYAGKSKVDEIKRIVKNHTINYDSDSKKFLMDHWYYLLPETDLVLLVAKFRYYLLN